MKKQKKEITPEEKKLKGKLKYRRSKRRKAEKDLDLFFASFPVDPKTKAIKIPKNKIIKFEGKDISYSTKGRILLGRVYEQNNKISDILLDLEKYDYKPSYNKFTPKLNKGDAEFSIGLVWEVDRNYPIAIFKNTLVKTVDGLDKKRDADKIISIVHEYRSTMDSKDIMYILVDQKGNGRIEVQNKNYNLK